MEPRIVLETRNLRKEFDGLVAVADVSLRVREGELHAIIGPNGAGKTTLFNLISGVLPPTAGKVFLRGQDITGLPPHQIARRGIGRSFQITNLFPNLTVLESVRLAAQARGRQSLHFWAHYRRYREYEERALEIIHQVGLTGREYVLARALPHGDQRKLEIALLLATGPDVLLLDEPTAGMASGEIPMLMDLIRRLREEGGRTILLVEHKMDVVMNLSDRITVMHQGYILAEGTPAEISADERVQRAYLGEL
ncbi:MAG: ABC transporter ATP-binding protein [Anaerolineae bacterium]|nr:ABC transporter ATP-binding protein [Anaerolineae bacterium]MCX8068435.1 ABC transporter ATP-binding protein [Anaerolineae bacterium]MDW7992026.1 ABC transporter ATP-binding protein [Anaerolineae bacterium]